MLGVPACIREQWKDSSQGLGRAAPRQGSRGGGLPCSLAVRGAPCPSGTASKPENLFQGTEGAEPGEGGQAPATAQQPRVHGVALPAPSRSKKVGGELTLGKKNPKGLAIIQ